MFKFQLKSGIYSGGRSIEKDILNSLNLLNLEKINNLVLDIDEKLQINPSEKITINIASHNYDKCPLLSKKIIGNTKIRLDFRRDALDFLKNKGIIYNYRIDDILDKIIEIELGIEKFELFKAKLSEIYKEKQQISTKNETKTILKNENTNIKNKFNTAQYIYEVKYTPSREILINNFLLSKVNFNSENDNVFDYIYKNPNRKIPIEELEKSIGEKLIKSPHKIIENLGFRAELKRVFFNISKNDIFFRNPITQKDLDELGIFRIKFPK